MEIAGKSAAGNGYAEHDKAVARAAFLTMNLYNFDYSIIKNRSNP